MKKLIIISGISGTGKTTLAKKMYQKRYDKDEQINRIIAICIDAIKDPYQGRKENLRSKLFRRMIIKIKRVIATADWFYRRGI